MAVASVAPACSSASDDGDADASGSADAGSTIDGGGSVADAAPLTFCSFRVCGPDESGGSCGDCTGDDVCSPFGQCVRETAMAAVVFFFDYDLDVIVRLEDKNGDGDMLGADEATIFFDTEAEPLGLQNALALSAVSADELLLGANSVPFGSAPGEIVRLVDGNGDGDAYDEGEASLWFDGILPDDVELLLPTGLWHGQNGAYYLVNNNVIHPPDVPEAVYRLEDTNGDGDVLDSGEVTVASLIAVAGDNVSSSSYDVRTDSTGTVFVKDPLDKDNTRVHRVYPSHREEYLTGYELYPMTEGGENLILGYSNGELGYLPHTDEIVVEVLDWPAQVAHLIAVRDLNGSGNIDALNEFRILWDSAVDDREGEVALKDHVVLKDGSIILVAVGEILRLTDVDGDGDMNDAGEVTLLYSAAEAASEVNATKPHRAAAVSVEAP